MQLDRQVQNHCLYPHPQSDVVQLSAPEYDLDIDGQTDQVLIPSTAQQSPDAENVQEDTTLDTTNSEQHTEDDEEDWEEGQFMDADFIDHHNTTEESDKIHREYSAHFEKVQDQEYNTYDTTTPGLEYQIPEQNYYNSDT